MGGRVATYEDSGEVFLRGSVSSVRRGSYPALQELDSSPFLPDFRRHSEFPGYGFEFNDWILSGLSRHGTRPSRQEVRPVGRRIEKPENSFIGFHENSHGRTKND
jgi:hypothetical protein